ncbi:hypothetical protein PybrP1_003402 [[Pythium] brassicae (nom. inval.)]|nr:hypothetical protein PybrP1_003402 [[Pythium] brassicae (nom. inval.)]
MSGLADAQHSGWVFKQGSLVRNWKKRFMVLRGRQLAYYDTASVTARTREKGAFQVITVELSSDIQNGLLVHGKGGRVLKLYTDSAESTRAWHAAILEATTGVAAAGGGRMSSLDARYSMLSVASSNNTGGSSVDVDEELELLDRLDSMPLDDGAAGGVESIHHSGWLKKEGSRVKSWKKRYFTLHGNTLSYYDSADTGSAAKGYGHVKGVEVNGAKTNGLDIMFERGRLLRVCAKTADDMEQWLCVLSEAIELQNAENQNIRQSIASRGSFRMSMPAVAVAKPRVAAMPMRHSIASAPTPPLAPSPSKPQQPQLGGSVPANPTVFDKAPSTTRSLSSSHSSYLEEYAMETDSDEYESDDSEGDWI